MLPNGRDIRPAGTWIPVAPFIPETTETDPEIATHAGLAYSLTETLQAQTRQYTNTLNTTNHTRGYQWPIIYSGAGNGACTTC